MFCGEACAEKLKKIVFVGSGPVLYFCLTTAVYSIYKHYANYKSPNHQEKIIGKLANISIFIKQYILVISSICFVIGALSLLGSIFPVIIYKENRHIC